MAIRSQRWILDIPDREGAKIFAENCMKMKEIGSLDPPMGPANRLYGTFQLKSHAHKN